MDQVKKIEFTTELFLEILKKYAVIPEGSILVNAYYLPNSNVVGVLIGSEEFPQCLGGDLALYAPYLEVKQDESLSTSNRPSSQGESQGPTSKSKKGDV